MQHTSSTSEEWRPVPGYEGYYEVSDHGRVRSVDRVVVGKDSREYRHKGKVRSLVADTSGHMQVDLRRGGNHDQRLVHRLVLESFVGPCPEGMEACHADGNATNNRLDNLRWDTQSANTGDMVKHGVHNNARKVTCKRGHGYEEWNLVSSAARRGGRQCKSCHKALVDARRKPGLKPHLQELADSNYLALKMSASR